MNALMQKLMADATALTRQGNLHGATLAIQHALRSHAAMPATARPSSGPGRETIAEPDSALVLDGLTRWASDVKAGEQQTGEVADSWTRGDFTFRGQQLAYRLFVPALATKRATPPPLIVMLHGCTQDAQDFATGTQMNALAQAQGFLVLYPQQAQRGNAQKCWNWFKVQHQVRDRGEPAMIAALTRSVMDSHRVDGSRIYVAGLSAGGAMADILGRAYPDLFAAVGVHSGLAAGAARDLPAALAAMRSGAHAAIPVTSLAPPTIVFHGDADTTVHPANGKSVAEACLRSQRAPLRTPKIVRGISGGGQRYTCTSYASEDGTAHVEHWQLHGGGHAWSGGSPQGSYTQPRGVDASQEIVRFFNAHRLQIANAPIR